VRTWYHCSNTRLAALALLLLLLLVRLSVQHQQ
jgi:hypothetical protein